MDNYYWQIYNELEKEMNEIMFTISFNAEQKYVYSPRIAELIVRAGMQIESVLQEIDHKTTDSKPANFKTIIGRLNKKWRMKEKCVLIASNRVESKNGHGLYLNPFGDMVDKEQYTGVDILYASKSKPNRFLRLVPKNDRCKAYKWENAYNNLKHNFYKTISKYGNVINLIEIMGALYLINLYFDPGFSVCEHSDSMLSSKSTIFSALIANCYIEGDDFYVDTLPASIQLDNCVFLRIKTINMLKEEISKRYGDEYELVNDASKYDVPDFIWAITSGINPIKNYDLLVRNIFNDSDFMFKK